MSFGLRKGIENAACFVNEAIEKVLKRKRTFNL
jgi:hypothetical protein